MCSSFINFVRAKVKSKHMVYHLLFRLFLSKTLIGPLVGDIKENFNVGLNTLVSPFLSYVCKSGLK